MELVPQPDGQITVSPDAVTYWKLRATIGDVERCLAQVNQLQEQLKGLAAARTELLREIAGPETDVNFVTAVTWDDAKREVTLTGAMRATAETV